MWQAKQQNQAEMELFLHMSGIFLPLQIVVWRRGSVTEMSQWVTQKHEARAKRFDPFLPWSSFFFFFYFFFKEKHMEIIRA